jgi:hypothetical protein
MVKGMTELGQVEEIDMSKCNFEGKFKEVSELLQSNKNLRTLSL